VSFLTLNNHKILHCGALIRETKKSVFSWSHSQVPPSFNFLHLHCVGRDDRNNANVSGVLVLLVLGLNMAVRLVCSTEEKNNVVCSFVFSIWSWRWYLVVMVTDPRNHTLSFPILQVNFRVCPQVHMGEMHRLNQDTMLRSKIPLQWSVNVYVMKTLQLKVS